MPLPIVLDAGSSDATAMIIAGLGSAVSAMAALFTTITLRKFGTLTAKAEQQEKTIHQLDIKVVWLEGQRATAAEQIAALKNELTGSLTKEMFQMATAGQNRTLADQNQDLAELKDAIDDMRDRLTEIDKSKVSRSDWKAARPPLPRTDGPSDSDPPVPPPRPRHPSRGRYGG